MKLFKNMVVLILVLLITGYVFTELKTNNVNTEIELLETKKVMNDSLIQLKENTKINIEKNIQDGDSIEKLLEIIANQKRHLKAKQSEKKISFQDASNMELHHFFSNFHPYSN